MAELQNDVRQKLALLLAGEDLDSPQQLISFEDNVHRTVSSWELFQRSIQGMRDRKARYREYDRMDESSDIKESLNAYAVEVTVKNRELDRTVWAVSDNKGLVEEIHELFDQIKVEEWIYGLARTTAKYGDDLEQVFYSEDGVYGLKMMEPWNIDRVTDDQGRLRGYKVQGANGMQGMTLQADAHPWDIAHFKINGTYRDGWGESMLAGVAKTWRILDQLETALALYRLYRAADRTVFYIDVGTTSNEQAYAIVDRWRQMYRKKKWYDEARGEIDFKHSPVDIIEDIFWPVRPGSESKVDKLQGSSNVGDIADVEMFRNKLRYALGIPKGYWGDDDGGVFDAKAGLVQQDMKFAQKCGMLQSALINGFTRLVQVHLALKGLNPNAKRFKLRMEPLSYLAEMQRMEAMQQRVIVLQGLIEAGQALGFDPDAWSEYVMKKVMFTTDDELNEFLEMQAEVVAKKQKDQADLERQAAENELDNQEADRKAKLSQIQQKKKDSEARAKTPGGQSGAKVTVNVNTTTKQKSKKSRMADEIDMDRDTLLEEDLAGDEYLSGITDYLAKNRLQLKEIKEAIHTLPSRGVVINLETGH